MTDTPIHTVVDAIIAASDRERRNYHLTYGQLIDWLRTVPPGTPLATPFPTISTYRGFYSDLALNTIPADGIDQPFPDTAGPLADALETHIGTVYDGYEGGDYIVHRDRPLWIAPSYYECSNVAVTGATVTDGKIVFVTKTID